MFTRQSASRTSRARRALRWLLIAIAAFAVTLTGAAGVGAWRWSRASHTAVQSLLADARATNQTFSADDVAELPVVVQRFFQRALREGQPTIQSAEIQHEGTFQMGVGERGWRPFRSRQSFTAYPAGFVWDASIYFAPLARVYVRDGLVGDTASIHASVLGLATVADQRGSASLNAGALQRWLAEAIWFPTALLPGNTVTWSAIDNDRARATVAAADTVVSLEFRFDDDGDVVEVFAPARAREVAGSYVPTPWLVRCTQHGEWNGVRIPTECSVAWQLPDAELPYWRGRVTHVRYDTARVAPQYR